MAVACADDIVVVLPCKAVPSLVPKPGNDVFAVFASNAVFMLLPAVKFILLFITTILELIVLTSATKLSCSISSSLID